MRSTLKTFLSERFGRGLSPLRVTRSCVPATPTPDEIPPLMDRVEGCEPYGEPQGSAYVILIRLSSTGISSRYEPFTFGLHGK